MREILAMGAKMSDKSFVIKTEMEANKNKIKNK